MYLIYKKGESQKTGYLKDSEESYPDYTCMKLPKSLNTVTANQFVEYLDLRAEGDNSHSFVGKHKEVCNLVRKVAGEKAAREVMLTLFKRGGLHHKG